MCRDSSVGRALDWRSKGPRFDPGSRQFFYFILDIQEWKCFSVIRPRFNTYSNSNSKVQNNEKSFSQNWETFQSQFFIQIQKSAPKYKQSQQQNRGQKSKVRRPTVIGPTSMTLRLRLGLILRSFSSMVLYFHYIFSSYVIRKLNWKIALLRKLSSHWEHDVRSFFARLSIELASNLISVRLIHALL